MNTKIEFLFPKLSIFLNIAAEYWIDRFRNGLHFVSLFRCNLCYVHTILFHSYAFYRTILSGSESEYIFMEESESYIDACRFSLTACYDHRSHCCRCLLCWLDWYGKFIVVGSYLW